MEGCMSGMMGNSSVQLCEGLKQLKEEHPPLLNMLEELLQLSTKVEEDPKKTVFDELTSKVELFISELDPHSEREEGVLFRMMEQYLGVGTGPIAVMEYEHDQAKRYISAYLKEAKVEEKLSESKMSENAGHIKNAYYTLTQHFAKEENVLFPMAQNMLSDEEKAELFTRINKI